MFWAATKLFTNHDLCTETEEHAARSLLYFKDLKGIKARRFHHTCVGIPGLHRLLADLRENSYGAMENAQKLLPRTPLGPVPGGASCVEFSHCGVVQSIGHPT